MAKVGHRIFHFCGFPTSECPLNSDIRRCVLNHRSNNPDKFAQFRNALFLIGEKIIAAFDAYQERQDCFLSRS